MIYRHKSLARREISNNFTHKRAVTCSFQGNLREGGDILRAAGQEEAGVSRSEDDRRQPDAERKATLGKLCRALSTIDENDEGLLSLQQLLQVSSFELQQKHRSFLLRVCKPPVMRCDPDAAGDGIQRSLEC
jgi:hypothetical protein